MADASSLHSGQAGGLRRSGGTRHGRRLLRQHIAEERGHGHVLCGRPGAQQAQRRNRGDGGSCIALSPLLGGLKSKEGTGLAIYTPNRGGRRPARAPVLLKSPKAFNPLQWLQKPIFDTFFDEHSLTRAPCQSHCRLSPPRRLLMDSDDSSFLSSALEKRGIARDAVTRGRSLFL